MCTTNTIMYLFKTWVKLTKAIVRHSILPNCVVHFHGHGSNVQCLKTHISCPEYCSVFAPQRNSSYDTFHCCLSLGERFPLAGMQDDWIQSPWSFTEPQGLEVNRPLITSTILFVSLLSSYTKRTEEAAPTFRTGWMKWCLKRHDKGHYASVFSLLSWPCD